MPGDDFFPLVNYSVDIVLSEFGNRTTGVLHNIAFSDNNNIRLCGFYSARNARIASAVLATAIPSVHWHAISAIRGRFLLIFALDKPYFYFRSSWLTDLESVSRDAHLALTVSTKFEVDTTIRCLVITLLLLIRYVTLRPWPLTFWLWSVVVHGGSRDQPLHEVWRSYDYPFLSYEFWHLHRIPLTGEGRSLGGKIRGKGSSPCQYIDTTRKAIECTTTLPLTVFI